MMKSFAFMMFLMGILIAQTAGTITPAPADNQHVADINNPDDLAEPNKTSEPVNENNINDDNSTQEEEEEEEDSQDTPIEENAMPLLTCVLFENEDACNAMCSIMGTIYGYPITSGTCQDDNNCECDIPENGSLQDYWKAKFNSDSMLKTISKNHDLSKKVLNVLRKPLQTYQKTIKDLESILPLKRLKRLRLRDSVAQNLIAENDAFDKTSIEKYVTEKMESFDNLTPSKTYKKTLMNLLNTAEGDELDHIVHEIRNSRNDVLNSVLDGYFKKNSIEQDKFCTDYQENIVQVLDQIIVNRVIRSVPRKNSNRAKLSLGARARSSSSESSVNEIDDKNAPWILPRFEKKDEVYEVMSGIRENTCWHAYDSELCIQKTSKKTTFLWKNLTSNSEVKMDISDNGDIKQNWKYNGNYVELKNLPSMANKKYKSEHWILGYSKLETYKNSDGTFRKFWEGDENKEAYLEFQRFIEHWCENNEFLIVKDECSIYKD